MPNEPNNSKIEVLKISLQQSLTLLEIAVLEVGSSELPNKREMIKEIAMAIGYISEAGFRLPGGLGRGVEPESPLPDGELSDQQQARVDELNSEELRMIDDALLAQCNHQFRKVARIVGFAMMDQPARLEGIPDIFYSQRVTELVEAGRLEHQGLLGHMRFCEVRLPQENASPEFFEDGEDIPQKQ